MFQFGNLNFSSKENIPVDVGKNNISEIYIVCDEIKTIRISDYFIKITVPLTITVRNKCIIKHSDTFPLKVTLLIVRFLVSFPVYANTAKIECMVETEPSNFQCVKREKYRENLIQFV